MKPIKIGAVGVTGRGFLAKHLHDENGRAVVAAGVDVSENALTEFKSHFPNAFTTTDYERMLNRDDIAAIMVTSPDFTHEEYVIRAFQAGKHVFCEKPMAITTEGCDRMLAAWRVSGKRFMVGFNMRYMNLFRVMKDIVDSGTIGEVKAVWVRHFVGTGGRWYFHDWHANRKRSTGLLLQKASHDIDMIHWITGKYTRRVVGFGNLGHYGGDKPNSLRCQDCPDQRTCPEYEYGVNDIKEFDQCAFREEIDVEDHSSILMELEGGVQATYSQCHYAPDYWRNYTFIGTEGRVENLDDTSRVIVKTRKKTKRWKNLADQTYEVKRAEGGHGGADPLICEDFLDMLIDGKEPVSTPIAGRMSVATAVAATESIRGGNGVVEVPPVPKEFQTKLR